VKAMSQTVFLALTDLRRQLGSPHSAISFVGSILFVGILFWLLSGFAIDAFLSVAFLMMPMLILARNSGDCLGSGDRLCGDPVHVSRHGHALLRRKISSVASSPRSLPPPAGSVPRAHPPVRRNGLARGPRPICWMGGRGNIVRRRPRAVPFGLVRSASDRRFLLYRLRARPVVRHRTMVHPLLPPVPAFGDGIVAPPIPPLLPRDGSPRRAGNGYVRCREPFARLSGDRVGRPDSGRLRTPRLSPFPEPRGMGGPPHEGR